MVLYSLFFYQLCFMKTIANIESKIHQLSPALIDELNHYLDYLINKKVVRSPKKLKQDWAGGLSDIKMSAIELQKKALEWRQK
jgi:hypothetical protein